jgi:hypothetical protein
MTTDAVPYLDGRCYSQGKRDLYHNECPGHMRTQFGTELTCACPNHHDEEATE